MSKTFTITSTIIAKFHKVCPSSSTLTSTIISKFHNQILYIHHHIASLIHKTTTNSLRFKFKFYREGERGVADLAPVTSCSSSDGRGRAGGARSRKRWPRLESRLLNMTRSLLCYRVLRVARLPRCPGEDLPQPVHLPRGCHCLWQDSGRLQVQVSNALPQSLIQVSRPALLPHS
jgi:hypothetical protein